MNLNGKSTRFLAGFVIMAVIAIIYIETAAAAEGITKADLKSVRFVFGLEELLKYLGWIFFGILLIYFTYLSVKKIPEPENTKDFLRFIRLGCVWATLVFLQGAIPLLLSWTIPILITERQIISVIFGFPLVIALLETYKKVQKQLEKIQAVDRPRHLGK